MEYSECGAVQCSVRPVWIPLYHTVRVEEGHADGSVFDSVVMCPLTHSNPHLRAVVLGEVGVLAALLVPYSE